MTNNFRLIGLLTILLGNSLYAQEDVYSVTGTVFAPEKKDLSSKGFVELFKQKDSTLVSFQQTGNSGFYNFQRLLKGNYFIRVSHPEFAVFNGIPFLVTSDLIDKNIVLEVSNYQLDEVVLKQRRPMAELDGDQMNVYVERIPGIEGDNSFELLSKLPGVWTEGDSSIKLNGSNDVTILINGRRQGFRNSQDINLLKTISAINIKKVEIISGGSAKYDATGGSVINIITKNKTFDGLNVNLNNTISINRELSNSHNLYLNVSSGKLNAAASVGYGVNKNYYDESGMATYNSLSVNSTIQDYDIEYDSENNSLSIYTNLNYDFNPLNRINLNITNYGNTNDITVFQESVYSGGTEFDLLYNNDRNVKDNLTSVQLSYESSLDSAGVKISTNIGYLEGFIKEQQEFYNNFSLNNPERDSLTRGTANIPLVGNQFIGGVDVEIPLDNFHIELGAKYTDGQIENFVTYNSITNNGPELDLLRSDSLIYKEKVFASYLLAKTSFKNFSFKAGARLEQTNNRSSYISSNTIAENKYINILPNVALSYKIRDFSTSLKFTSGITRPDYVYLNPYQYYINEFEYREGNPNLKPLKRNTFTLENSLWDFLNITLGYHRINDMIFVVNRQENENLQVVSSPENAAALNDFFVNISLYYRLLDNKWGGQLSLYGETYNYDIDEQFITDSDDLDNFTYFTLQFNNSYEISEKWSVFNEFSYRSNSTFYQIFQKERYRLDLGITAKLFQDRIKITAGVDDIFNTYDYENRTYYDGYEKVYFRELSLRRFQLSVNIDLDRGWKKSASKSGNDNVEELNRFKN